MIENSTIENERELPTGTKADYYVYPKEEDHTEALLYIGDIIPEEG